MLREAGCVARARWLQVVMAAVISLAFALVLHRWDPVLENWIRDHQNADNLVIARRLSHWGELHLGPLIWLCLLGLFGLWRRVGTLAWAGLTGVLAGCVGGILVNILKVIVGRPRPYTSIPDGIHWFSFGGEYASFPSGHATHCLAIAAAVGVLAPRWGALMVLASVAVGWSRWYLMRHYMTDLWAGACFGLVIGLIFGCAARRLLSVQALDKKL